MHFVHHKDWPAKGHEGSTREVVSTTTHPYQKRTQKLMTWDSLPFSFTHWSTSIKHGTCRREGLEVLTAIETPTSKTTSMVCGPWERCVGRLTLTVEVGKETSVGLRCLVHGYGLPIPSPYYNVSVSPFIWTMIVWENNRNKCIRLVNKVFMSNTVQKEKRHGVRWSGPSE